jgi:CO/xanthine dehydrogenase Mo-binding subunit
MEIGGGFGGKLPVYVEPVAAVLSKKTGHPVKLTMSRAEVLEATGPTSGSYVRITIGSDKDGKITAAKAVVAFEAGAFPPSPITAAAAAVFAPYKIDNVMIDAYDVLDNKPKVAPYRAPGAPIVAFAAESVVNELAEELGVDAIDLRILNAASEGDRRADGVMNGRIGALEMMEAVKSHPHYSAPLAGENSGRGVGLGFCRNNSGPACAIGNVLADGRVSLIEGSMDIGGSRTAIAQMFAEVLGLTVEDVIPTVGDTETIGYTSNTGGSGVTFKSGWAAFEAANDVKRQIVERAARLWEVDLDEIEYVNGEVQHRSDTELRMTFKAVAATANETGGPIVGRANLNPGGSAGSYSALIVDVEVDSETGKTDITRATAFQDVGTAIHPSYVEGQIQGGTAQGIGWALNEEYYLDDDGVMQNSSLLDYRMPTSLDLPMIETVMVEVPNPNHPYGVKGVGEASISAPLAAVAHAIKGATGVRLLELPMNPQAIVKATSV